jgi:hypothetical protein
MTVLAWTAGGTMGTVKRGPAGSAGIQTAALAAGGSNGTAVLAGSTEEYDGCKLDSRWNYGNC